MSVFKCKMCGGTIEFEQGATVGVCDSCGTKQTLPKSNDEVIGNLFSRANNLRLKCEFDKAEQIYEKIVDIDNTESEAHWGIVLCKYGIEYVEDPKTFNKVPTCHRTLFEAVLSDADFLAAVENADSEQRELYEKEARMIDSLQKDILSIVQKEKPFDVFICYKETDESGKRTVDSALANDIYYQLTKEGFKVFYAAITLEDKLGKEYEPYIFAALNSAKVMLVVGTRPDFFDAVWVRNEWSRFLKLMKTGREKLLIPCYKDMDAYELPEEFAHLQAQDMSKIGFINDLVRGIKKVVADSAPKTIAKETVVVNGGTDNIAPLLKRAFMFLEDGDWERADDFCEQVLNQDPENAEAYLGKLMVELNVTSHQNLKNCSTPFDGRNNFQKAMRFADENLKKELQGYADFIVNRNLMNVYNDAVTLMRNAKNEEEYKSAAAAFSKIPGYKTADSLKEQCLGKARICRKDSIYASAKSKMTGEKVTSYEEAIKEFQTISGWKDSDEQIYACQKKIEEIKAKEEADRLEAERKAEEKRIAAEKAKKKRKKVFAITTPIVAACIAFVIVLTTVIIPSSKYSTAMDLYNAGKYAEAITAFSSVNYKDSSEKASECIFLIQKDRLKDISVGKTLKFGSYEQDNNTSNGKEEIEWKVIAVDGNKALVISKYALDCKQYNSSYTGSTWEKSLLCSWLNNTFLSDAFGSKHQEMILDTYVSADKNPKYSTNPGNATKDKVFLLSITEAKKYFATDEARKCAPTAYAKAQGAYTSDDYKTASGEATCWWWLRSPGEASNYAASVHDDGSVDYGEDGWGALDNDDCVRPALWINIE